MRLNFGISAAKNNSAVFSVSRLIFSTEPHLEFPSIPLLTPL